MDSLSEGPPTSIIPFEDCNYSQVVFGRVEKSYEPATDVKCYFTYNQNFMPNKKDWVGIFKVSWKTTREYYTWISAVSDEDGLEKYVTFKAYYLPKENDDYYQFCYVDHNGEVRGVSIPFQFCRDCREEEEDDILMVTTEVEAMEMKQHQKLRENILKLEEKVTELQKVKGALEDELSLLQKNKVSLTEAFHAQLQASNEDLEHQNKELQTQLDSEKNRREALEVKVMSLEQEGERKKKDNGTLQQELEQLKNENEILHSDLKQMEILINKSVEEKELAQKENIAQREDLEKLNLILGLRVNEYTNLKKQHEVHLQNLETEKEKTAKLKESLAKEKCKVEKIEQDLEDEHKLLESTREKAEMVYQQLSQCQSENSVLREEMEKLSLTVGLREIEIKEMKKILERENADLQEKMRTLNYTISLRELEINELKEQRERDNREINKMYKKLNEKDVSTHSLRDPFLSSDSPYEAFGASSMAREQLAQQTGGFQVEDLKCPQCGEAFQDFQIFNDHILCHDLE